MVKTMRSILTKAERRVRQCQDYIIYRPIIIHPTTKPLTINHSEKGPFWGATYQEKTGLVFLGGGERYVRFLREIWWGCPRIIIYRDMDENGIMKKTGVSAEGPFWPAARVPACKDGPALQRSNRGVTAHLVRQDPGPTWSNYSQGEVPLCVYQLSHV